MKALLATAVAALAVAGAAAASASALQNPCALLKAAHAEKTLAKGATVKPGALKKYGSGALESDYCSETVGALTVSLSVAHNSGGFGGIKVSSETHPSGLGA